MIRTTGKFLWLWSKYEDFQSRWILFTEWLTVTELIDERFDLESRIELGGPDGAALRTL